jgi:thermitase
VVDDFADALRSPCLPGRAGSDLGGKQIRQTLGGGPVFRWGRHLLAALLILILLSIVPWLALSAQAEGPKPEAPFVPGEVLVKFKAGLTSAKVDKVKKELGLATVGQIAELGVQKMKVRPGDEQKLIEKLRSDPAVEYAEPNYILYAMPTYPNDTYYFWQWGLPQIQAPAAWDIVTATVPVTIAIVDTGVDLTHPDFSCPGKLTAGWDFVNNDSDPSDDYGHGTHVAGIAAACTNNSTGVAGVSWGARIMPVKVLGSSGSGSVDNVAQGIIYAADNKAQVINMSLGGYGLENDQTFINAIVYAYSKGCLLVAAGGNGGISTPMYPAAYTHVIAVAATDSSDNRAGFSNYGSYIDVAAPGVSIYSTERYGSYGYMDGTSVATPFVSGLAALVWFANPSLTNDQVENIIESTADDLYPPGRDDYFGWGRINAATAVQMAAPRLDLSTHTTFFLADDSEVLPASQQINVLNLVGDVITWTATISPPVSWLAIVPPNEGLATQSSPGTLALTATRPSTYGTYTATVVITGVAPGVQVQDSPQELDVSMYYLPELYRQHLLLIFNKSQSP